MSGVTVKKDDRGIFYARPYLGCDPVTKQQLRRYRAFPEASTEAEAQHLADEWYATLTPVGREGTGMSLPSLLTLYVDHLSAYGHAPSTIDAYYSIIHAQVVPYLGSIDPNNITSYDIIRFAETLLAPPSRGGRGLTLGSVRKTYSFLHGAFKWLAREKFIDRDPMLGADYPALEHAEARALTPEEYRALLSTTSCVLDGKMDTGATRHDRFMRVAAIATRLGLALGTRISETCALRVRSVNERTMTIRINQAASQTRVAGFVAKSPKHHSVRNISIEQPVLEIVDTAKQLLASYGVHVTGATYLVSADGTMLRPQTLRVWFRKLVRAAGLPDDVTYHTLRHTLASMLIAEGMDLRTISDMLGHADMATTARIYAHVIPGRSEAAAKAITDITDRYS